MKTKALLIAPLITQPGNSRRRWEIGDGMGPPCHIDNVNVTP